MRQNIPVADDSIAPAWLEGSTPDMSHPYVQFAEPISVQVQDDFGFIENSTLKARITGQLADGGDLNQDLESKLAITAVDRGYLFTGDINPVPDGHYVLSFHAQDMAGNVALPDPLIKSFTVDHTPPEVILSQIGQVYTNQVSSAFGVVVKDYSPTQTSVNKDGQKIIQTADKDISVHAALSEGLNRFVVHSEDAARNAPFTDQSVDLILDTQSPKIAIGREDHLIVKTSNFSLPIEIVDTSPTQTKVLLNGQAVLNSTSKQFVASLPLVEGSNTVEVQSIDAAQNEATAVTLSEIFLDSKAPEIFLGTSDHQLLGQSEFVLPVTVTDATATATRVLLNGNAVNQTTEASFTTVLSLREGLNFIEIQASDAAGNAAVPVILSDIVLDSTPPTLANFLPSSGSTIASLSVPVSVSSDEPIMLAQVNGKELELSVNKTTASGTLVVLAEGALTLHWDVYDRAGNHQSAEIPVQVVLKILNGDLLSVAPDPDGTHLWVSGATSAARPGSQVTITAGLFSSYQTVADQNGSFQVKTGFFNQATVTAKDLETGRTESAPITYNIDTRLSGVVLDPEKRPLPGVTVRIGGNSPIAMTDSSGSFIFNNPVSTGDQTLTIDPSTMSLEVVGPRKFSAVNIVVSIGLNQSNVLARPIYLTPLYFDGTETEVVAGSSAVVTSPHAPGVVLNIPANVTTFPGGSSQGLMSVGTIPAEAATIEPPANVKPATVVHLEPSGVSFAESVQLTLPNENELKPGTEMAILSMNSEKGLWEIDGAAVVSDDGQSVVTKPGMGITHFSEVFAVPVGMTVKEIGSKDRPGVDSFNGAVSTSIALPSYKVAGQSITPTLMYNSSWAAPRAVVTNMFDIPPTQLLLDEESDPQRESGRRYVPRKINCFPSVHFPIKCWEDGDRYYWDLEYNFHNRVEVTNTPELVTARFFSGSLTSDLLKFKGVPSRAVVSFAMDLKDPETNTYFSSGIYQYRSQWAMYLKRLYVSSINQQIRNFRGNIPRPTPIEFRRETELLQMIFPPDLVGSLFVQNEANSAVGQGWKVAGVQKIANPGDNKLMIEEGTGSIATYSINNRIESLYDATEDTEVEVDMKLGAVLNAWPNGYVFARSKSDISKYYLRQIPFLGGQPSNRFATVGRYTGVLSKEERYWWTYDNCRRLFSIILDPQEISVQFSGASIYGITSFGTLFKSASTNDLSILAGLRTQAFRSEWAPWGVTPTEIEGSYCGYYRTPICGPQPISTLPTMGKIDGDLASHTLFNNPKTMIAGKQPNTLVVADSGNNVVRLVDLSSNQSSTIAGNGWYEYFGDGGLATAAALNHPRGLAYDSAGNLYVSTLDGYIRKIDSNGVISTFAGLPLERGGTIEPNGRADQMAFSQPYGLAVDDDNKFLYVADTGNNRVIQIDLYNKSAITIAGGTGCIDLSMVTDEAIGDSRASLEGKICRPTHLGFDDHKNLLIVDSGHQRIRRVIFQNAAGGILAFSPTSDDGSLLTRNVDGTWTRKYRNGNLVQFDSSGYQTLAADRAGRQTAYAYDVDHKLIAVTDPAGGVTRYDYSFAGYLQKITDPSQRITHFEHEIGRLSRVIFPDGSDRRYTYTGSGHLLSEIDQANNETRYVYNELGRVQEVIKASGTSQEAKITISDSGSVTAAKSSADGTVNQFSSYGTETGDVYDGIKDPQGTETKFKKDLNGFVTKIIDAENRETTIIRDFRGSPIEIRRPDGTNVSYSYDEATHDLLSQTDTATGQTTSQTYDQFGNATTSTNARGVTTTTTYDEQTGLALSKSDSLTGLLGSTEYNHPLKLVTKETNALGKSMTYTYDSNGNVKTITDPLGRMTSYERDAAGNVTSVSNAKNQKTLYEYDSMNRMVAVVTPKGERTEYAYLATGALQQIRDAHGNVTTFDYDALGQMVKKTDPQGNVITRNYDLNGNVASETDPNGNTKLFTYNKFNKLVKKTLPDNVITLDYDLRGNLNYTANEQSELIFSYDNGSRLTTARSHGLGTLSDLPDVTLQFTYNPDGSRDSMTDPRGMTQYTYDLAGRLTSLTNPRGEVYSFAFDSGNRLTQITRPGSQTLLAFDDANFISSIIHSSGGTTFASFSYTLDQVGNRTSIRTPAGDFNFDYDLNNQIISATNPEAPVSRRTDSFSYDSVYNRTTDQGGAYSYHQNLSGKNTDRLVEDYRYQYFYDNNGNMIKKVAKAGFPLGEVTNLSYSSENQLVAFRVYEPNSTQPVKEVTYTYDGFGRRIQKQVIDHRASNDPAKTFTRRYVYDGQEVVLEYDESNALLAHYTHSTLRTDDILAAEITSAGVSQGLAQSSGSYQFIKDAQGTVTDITDSGGNKIQHYIYSVFGELLGIQDAQANDVTSAPPVKTSYTYTGREHDSESGFYYYRARYYDPGTGRFLQKDPEPGKLNISATVVNSYIYVLNNPLNLTDPNGHGFWEGLGFLAAGIGLVALAVFTGGVALPLILGALGSGFISAAIPAFKENINWGEVGDAFAGAAIGTILTAGIGGAVGALARGAASYFVGAATANTVGIIAGAAAGFGFGAYMGSYGRTGSEAIGYGIAGGFFGAFAGGFGAANLSFPSFSPLTPSTPVPALMPSAPVGLPFAPPPGGPIFNQPQLML